MQSGDELKIINAARYLQHLCYSKESVTKDKVKFLVENATSPFYFIGLGLGKFIGAFSDLTQDSQENDTKKTKRRFRRKIQSQYFSGKRLTLRKQLPYGLK